MYDGPRRLIFDQVARNYIKLVPVVENYIELYTWAYFPSKRRQDIYRHIVERDLYYQRQQRGGK